MENVFFHEGIKENIYNEPERTRLGQDDLEETLDKHKKMVEELNEENFYAILNISRNATESQIRESYHRLSRAFHPDKHQHSDSKAISEEKFRLIQYAYEVLMDPRKRWIYDMYGEEGLKFTWDIGKKFKTSEEVLAELERQMHRKNQQNLENMVKSRGHINLVFDASPLFQAIQIPTLSHIGVLSHSRKLSFFERIKYTGVSSIFMKHSFSVPLSFGNKDLYINDNTTFTLIGQMMSKNKISEANIIGVLRHVYSAKLWFETGIYILDPKLLFSKLVYTFNRDSFMTIQTQFPTFYAPPQLIISSGKRLTPQGTGFVTFRTGCWNLGQWGLNMPFSTQKSSFTLGWQNTSKSGSSEGFWNVEITAGVANSGISYEWSSNIKKGRSSERLKLTTSISTNGIVLSAGTYRKLGEDSNAELDVSLTLPQGMIILKILFSRLGQKIVIPIVLSTKYSLKASLWGVIIPISTLVILETIYLKPNRIKKRKEKIFAIKKEYQECLNMKKKKAEEFLHLMCDMVHKKQYYEKQKEGLFIIKALYGDFTTGDVIDVTIAIAALVNDSQLTIHHGFSKSQIIGIWDPAFGQKKTLRVEYSFKGRVHFVEVEDKHGLIAPLREHLVTNIKQNYL
ncbi:uncharacterized protein T551_03096 [Pneumocystis jirovecii RU7]|uniref:J domain-containing protein n=1 Tax=Pneumocystis jirovecii (strain RU7) TaxID=1408657 RepID=A0A0W4ZGV5_PNEJ7|nr:uncharacterized protein T551_03096 [Pneumocystis jirovecii RU7]KTW27597.1 hypothetical protein T551_03096 [Pneumocystis jirovecii RU7]